MAQKTDIRLRRSDTAGKIPTSANLSDGELAINTGSGALYFKKSDGTIITAHDNTILHIDSDTTGSSTTGTNPKVGIGTTSPDKTLDVLGDIRSIDSSNNQHQLRATQVISYGTDAILNAQSTGDDVRLNTQGTTRLIATAEGNVGIGTDSPSQKLHIADATPLIRLQDTDGSNTFGQIRFNSAILDFMSRNDTANGAIRFSGLGGATLDEFARFDSTGNFGIGTTTPATELDVNGAITGSGLLKINEGANLDGHTIGRLVINYQSNGNPALASHGGDTVHIEDDLMIQGANLTKSTTGPADFNIRQARTGYDIVFQVAPSANNTFIDAMKILTDGKVGIGTSSPATKLHVGPDVLLNTYTTDRTTLAVSDITDGAELILRGQSPRIWFDATSSGNGQMYMDSAELQIYSGRPGAVGTQRLNINSSGAITFNEAFTFPTSIGSAGQVLKVPNSGTTLQWADETGGGGSTDSITDADGDTKIQLEESADEDVIRFDVAGSEIATMTDDGVILNNGYNFEGDVVGAIKFKAQAGEALTKGDVVYISGISGNTTVVSKADANDSAKMPAFGLAASTVSLNAAVEIVTFGTLQGIDTSTPNYSEGDELFVSTTAGELTDTAPTGSGSLLQKIAKVTRVDASAGSVKVSGAGRTNATPNLDEGKLFVGNSSNQSVQGDDTLYVDMANSRVGINTTNPTYKLHVGGSGKSYLPGGIQLDSTNRIDFGNGNQYITGANDTSLTLATGGSASLTILDNGNITAAADLTITGDLTVQGTTTTLNTATLDVEDKNITIADGAANATDANGAGITVDGANATLTYTSAQDEWNFNKNLVVGGKETTASFPLMVKSDTSHQGLHIEENSGAESWQMGVNAAGDFNFYNSGSTTPSITFEDSGQVGIGTSSPAAQLNVDSNAQNEIARFQGANAQLRIDNSTLNLLTLNSGGSGDSLALATSGTEAIRIDSNQNVGIGTTSPDVKLHLEDASRVDIKFEKTGSETHYIRKDGNFLRFRGHDDSTVLFELKNNTDGSNAASFPNGNLGIGTTSPNCALHVNGQQIRIANGGPILTLQDTTDDDDHTIRFQDSVGTTRFSITSLGDNFNFITSGSRDIRFVPNDSEAVRIDSNGNVGIGDDSPDFKLTVKTPAIPSGSTYAWPLDLSRPNTDNRGLTFGVAASGTTNAIAGHNADVGIGHTYGTDSNGLPQYYETLRVKHIDQAVGNVGIGVTDPKAKLQVEEYGIDTTETSTSATTQVAIHTFAATDFRSARFTIQVTNSTDSTYHTTEILLVHDGTDVYITEFGEIHTGVAEEATFDADINSGNVRLLATPASTDAMEFKVVCHSVTV